ncbi:hypothetical protein [Chryseobacterium sp. 18068]|uniref:hypothetical protein n=1 Tax=Chryseobacterium sp. 18068 TaxID=2681414 RepID=UPI001357ED01|nr:hypothetical protein [Chryseobacterium sp. 18068]
MRILILSAIVASQFFMAQSGNVGINTSTPQATLDLRVASSNLTGTSHQGLLIPKLGRERINNMGANVEEGVLIYVNNLDGQATGRVSKVNNFGFYSYNGTEWVSVANSNVADNIVLTPSSTTINKGESITINVKSDQVTKFFYTDDKGSLKKMVNNKLETLSGSSIIGNLGLALMPTGQDFIYTPSIIGQQNVKFYFLDSDNNLVVKDFNLQVNGAQTDELVNVELYSSPLNELDELFMKVNGSAGTNYQIMVEYLSGSLTIDASGYGWGFPWTADVWHNISSPFIELAPFKYIPGSNSMKIKVRKANSPYIEWEKEIVSGRKIFVDNTTIRPMSKTMQVNTEVELSLNNFRAPNITQLDFPDGYYAPRGATLSTNLPLEIRSIKLDDSVLDTYYMDDTGFVSATGPSNPISFTFTATDLPFSTLKKYLFKPTSVGTYFLRFTVLPSKVLERNQPYEITVVLTVTP